MNTVLPPSESHDDTSGTGIPEPAIIEVDRDSLAKMLGEFLREAAVLTFVFIPLDMLINQRSLTWIWGSAIVVLPIGFFSWGAYVERTRRK